MGFSRQEYWSRLPFPSPGELPNLRIETRSLPHCRQMLYQLSYKGSPAYKTGRALKHRTGSCLYCALMATPNFTFCFKVSIHESWTTSWPKPQSWLKNFISRLPWWLSRYRICLQCRRTGFSPWVGKFPWRRDRLPTSVLLPGESHGQRSLVGYSSWGRKSQTRLSD